MDPGGSGSAAVADEEEEPPLTEEQKQRIHSNKEKALALRELRKKSKPYDDAQFRRKKLQSASSSVTVDKPQEVRGTRNTHAGFIMEDDGDDKKTHSYRKVEDAVPALPDELMKCEGCGTTFAESYLHSKFNLDVCDKCREPDGKHSMITKSDAKQKYLLQDYHFESTASKSALPFLLKKNPHTQWGEMKLFLQCQRHYLELTTLRIMVQNLQAEVVGKVEARSYEVWGGKAGLEREHEIRGEKKEKKVKQYAKEIKALRRAVRSGQSSSLPGLKSHVHDFPAGEEKYDADSDSWTKTCSECGFIVSFEKM